MKRLFHRHCLALCALLLLIVCSFWSCSTGDNSNNTEFIDELIDELGPEITFFSAPEEHAAEGIIWYDFELRDAVGTGLRVDANYEGEHIGISRNFSDDSSNVQTGIMQLNTLGLPSTAEIEIVVTNDKWERDTLTTFNLDVIGLGKRELTIANTGVDPNHFDLQSSVVGPDGWTYFATYEGLMILKDDLSISSYRYEGRYGRPTTLLYVFVGEDDQIYIVDSRGELVHFTGSALERIAVVGDLPITSFDKIVYSKGDHFWFMDGNIYRHDPETDSTYIDSLAARNTRASALSSSPDGKLYLALYDFASVREFLMFKFENDSWVKLELPEGEPEDGFGDYTYGRISTIVTDDNGVVWFGRGESIFEYDGQSFVQHRLPRKHYGVGPLAGCNKRGIIKDLHVDSQGDIWIAANQGGLFRFDHSRFYMYPVIALSDLHRSCSSEKPVVTNIYATINDHLLVETLGDNRVLSHLQRILP